jgi:undecaprenyl-diphosphatase
MDLLQALILGLVEGITEYLPVSSTGHLLIAQRLLCIEQSAAANGYVIAIQGGAIVAVLGTYRTRVADMVGGLIGRNADGLKLALCIIAAFMPAAILGVLFDDVIEARLFGVKPVIAAWIVGGVGGTCRWCPRQRHRAPNSRRT